MKGKRMFPGFRLVVVLSCTLLVFVGCAGVQTEAKKIPASVAIEPPSGAKGSNITINGTGYQAGEEIDIVLIMGPGQRIGLGTEKVDAINADGNGAFTAASNIPSWAKPGTYEVVVEGGKGSMAKTTIEVK